MLPDSFWPNDRDVDVQSAFASTFFTPDIASAPDIAVIAPDGTHGTPDRVEVTEAVHQVVEVLGQQTAPVTFPKLGE